MILIDIIYINLPQRVFMFLKDNIEEKLHLNEKKIRELSIRLEKLESDITNFLEELEVTPEQLSTFISKKENFTEENWLEIQKQKKQLDEKLDLDLKNVRNPLNSKKALASLNVGQFWLHVK